VSTSNYLITNLTVCSFGNILIRLIFYLYIVNCLFFCVNLCNLWLLFLEGILGNTKLMFFSVLFCG
jgi:hypothetical protein